MDSTEVWTDSLDDLSHVYVPGGGLSGVEVSGGLVRLAAGETEGWIASSIIRAKPGLLYDFVLLDVNTPGNSTIDISILDATEESSVIGFANETITGYVYEEGEYLSVWDVDPASYPELRIQVNLHAAGSDRPVLKAWSLHYIPPGEWRDEFLGPHKMTRRHGLNLTDGTIGIDFDRGRLSEEPGDYEPYPPVVGPAGNHPINVFYPNADHTGYQQCVELESESDYLYGGAAIADLNDDGHLELITAVGYLYSTGQRNARIFWGSEEGTWDYDNGTNLTHGSARVARAGDFNGDGHLDIAFAGYGGSALWPSTVFLNKGGGVFNSEPDIEFEFESNFMEAGDINSDGYDDLVFYCYTVRGFGVFFGGRDGPDVEPDILFPYCSDPLLMDANADGYLDILARDSGNTTLLLFLGGKEGIDTTPDISLDAAEPYTRGFSTGDINGDGYLDLIWMTYETDVVNRLYFFEGTDDIWSEETVEVYDETIVGFFPVCGDIDRDGYDDILIRGTGKIEVWAGGPTMPTSANMSLNYANFPYGLCVAIPPKERTSAMGCSFVTEAITLPPGKKWDVLSLEGILPPNTTRRISILDSTGKTLSEYKALDCWNIDLSDITLDIIMVLVAMSSESNTTGPTLERLTVKWLDEMEWRDQFYTDTRANRLLGYQVSEGFLRPDTSAWGFPQLVFSSTRSDTGFDTKSKAFFDDGTLTFDAKEPMDFNTKGAVAVDAADVNGDGFIDVAFALNQTAKDTYDADSPLFLNKATGWHSVPYHTFPTTGAMDILLQDLNDDGHVDVVFAQELKAKDDYYVNSILFWGSAAGWNATPDVNFSTKGATDVEAVDIDGDGHLDLVFACYKDTSTTTDSMVFLQDAGGFDGTTPSYMLRTNGARGVAVGDLNGDTSVDLVFANSFAGGQTEIDSYIYMSKAVGGFSDTPVGLPTIGAEDVEVADLDGDGDLDIVFANNIDNSGSRMVESYVYLNDGSGGFTSSPSAELSTNGAMSVCVCDLDGAGWKDLVFACQHDGSTYSVPSVIYLGGSSGWSLAPDIELPTVGASDVIMASLVKLGNGGYKSMAITPTDPKETGTFHTFRYTAEIGAAQSARVQLVDAVTEELLAEVPMQTGTHEWLVEGAFYVKEHPSIRVVVLAEGLDKPGIFQVDELWLNWTERIHRPPTVLGLTPESSAVYRLGIVGVNVSVKDEYDLVKDLYVTVEYRLNGTSGWKTSMLGTMVVRGDIWLTEFRPLIDTQVGSYDFRVQARDDDGLSSDPVIFPNAIEVRNNLPSTPEIRLTPARPVTTSTLSLEIVVASRDVESSGVTYVYRWYRDGVLQENITGDTLFPIYTSKGQNWSVEVRGHDGEEMGEPATVWRVIENAAPVPTNPLPDPFMDEDTVDSDWLDLSTAFEDPDGDTITWTVNPTPLHIGVEIDQTTGKVTLIPKANWNGAEDLTFIATDGELQATATVTVTVDPVNDIPSFATVNGEPITSDPVEFTIMQGELLVIDVLVTDVEDDEMVYSVNTTLVNLDDETGRITFQTDNEGVGTLRFGLRVYDTVSPDKKVSLNFTITVENANDPMSDPIISKPGNGDRFEVNETFSLLAVCTDPDMVYGQVLNYSWSSNGSGHLGYGSSLSVRFQDAGTHVITLTVTDGEFQKTATVTIEVEPVEEITPPPPPEPDDDEEGLDYGLVVGVVVVLVVIGAALYVMSTKRRTEEAEAADEAEYKREHMERAREAVKAAADHLEEEREEAPPPKIEYQEVKTGATPDGTLTMQATVTEAPSAATAKLFTTVAAEPAMTEEEREQLRMDNLKRKYQNAIGKLPYGIPSKELADWEWVDLAAALATGEKKTTPQGRELTQIEGRWYYSDVKDTGTFLKEHGAKPKAPKAKDVEVATDKMALLAKLEERFILGEISEEAYLRLVEKYSEDE